MIKATIYPKTTRIGNDKVVITEKLDGSNLVFFKLNGVLHIAQRNNIYTIDEIDKGVAYRGLYEWLLTHARELEDNLHEGSAICGEWLGMGQIKYDVGDFDKRFYIFAKANINEDLKLYNLIYDRELFVYPFVDQTIPHYIGIVPKVIELRIIPSVYYLDGLYDKYIKTVDRKVEGFVLNYNNSITKYVRFKRGKLTKHYIPEGGKE